MTKRATNVFNAYRVVQALACTCICTLFASHALAGNTWDGGGGSDNRWSNPLNWSGDQLPIGTGTLTFPAGATTIQDLFTSTAGIPNSNFAGIDFLGSGGIDSPSNGDGAIGLANARIAGAGNVSINAKLIASGTLRLDSPTSGFMSVRSIAEAPGFAANLSINNDVAHAGDVGMWFGERTYTGTTTINRGVVALSALGLRVNTHDQSDYVIGATASLFASGTIGLSSNKRVDNFGTISNAGDGPSVSLNIVGDLKMEPGSTWSTDIHTPSQFPESETINVSGLLDLSAAADRLSFVFIPSPLNAPTYVLSNYGSRVGTFDNIVGLRPGMSIAYTSGENAGPGQVLLVVPEPMTAAWALSFMLLRRRPSRRTCA